MAMTPYQTWYGGLGGYARVETARPSALVLEFKPRVIVPEGWAAWYKAAAEGAW